jgi:hypothetical protein
MCQMTHPPALLVETPRVRHITVDILSRKEHMMPFCLPDNSWPEVWLMEVLRWWSVAETVVQLGDRSLSGNQVVPDRGEQVTPSGVVGTYNMCDKPCRMCAPLSGTWSGVFRIYERLTPCGLLLFL